MTRQEIEQKFEEYWQNKQLQRGYLSGGPTSQGKYDAAKSAWMIAWRLGFDQAVKMTLGEKECHT